MPSALKQRYTAKLTINPTKTHVNPQSQTATLSKLSFLPVVFPLVDVICNYIVPAPNFNKKPLFPYPQKHSGEAPCFFLNALLFKIETCLPLAESQNDNPKK
jgi:hypothetical protein